jgi:ABC-type hemin transport system substrate-binding protein
VNVNSMLEKAIGVIIRRNSSSVQPIELKQNGIRFEARKLVVEAIAEGHELVNELGAGSQYVPTQSASVGPRAETTLQSIRDNLEKHQR